MTRENFEQWLATPEGWQVARPAFDRYAQKAIETHDAKTQITTGSPDALADENKRLKIEISIRDESTRHNLDVATVKALGLQFDSEADVPARIESLAQTIRDQVQRGVNERLVAETHRPGSGNGSPTSKPLSAMSEFEMILAEQSGELNDRIEHGR